MRSLFLGFFARRAGNHPLRGSPRKRQGCAWDGSSIPSPCSTRPAVSPDTLIWTLGCLVIFAPYLLWQSRRRALRKARAESLALGLRPFFEREIPIFSRLSAEQQGIFLIAGRLATSAHILCGSRAIRRARALGASRSQACSVHRRRSGHLVHRGTKTALEDDSGHFSLSAGFRRGLSTHFRSENRRYGAGSGADPFLVVAPPFHRTQSAPYPPFGQNLPHISSSISSGKPKRSKFSPPNAEKIRTNTPRRASSK